MQRYVETDDEHDGFGEEDLTFTKRSSPQSAKRASKPKPALSRFVEPEPQMRAQPADDFADEDAFDEQFGNLSIGDDGIEGTLRQRPPQFADKTKDQDQDKTGHGTVRKRGQPKDRHKLVDFEDDGFDEGFEFPASNEPLRPLRPQEQIPDFGMSDSDRSPSRHSHSSSTSSFGSALTESMDDEDEFELADAEAEPLDLQARFRAREIRAKIESSAQETLKFGTQTRRTQWARQYGSSTDEDEIAGLDFDRLDLNRGTVNRNVVFGTIKPPRKSQSRPNLSPSRLKPAISFAQLPTTKTGGPGPGLSGAPSAAPGALRASASHRLLRPAKSMYNIAGSRSPTRLTEATSIDDFEGMTLTRSSRKIPNLAPPLENVQRSPTRELLAAYAEPEDRRIRASRKTKAKKSQSHGNLAAELEGTPQSSLHDRRRRKVGLIRNPGMAVARQEMNGMIFDPVSGMWEGNEGDLSKFDTIKLRDTMLIPFNEPGSADAETGDMVFDSKNLCWIPRAGVAAEDPFADFDDDELGDTDASDTRFMASTASFASSIGRRETSTVETFVVPPSVQRTWRDADARFVRKFGRWISREADSHEAAQDIYKMVH